VFLIKVDTEHPRTCADTCCLMDVDADARVFASAHLCGLEPAGNVGHCGTQSSGRRHGYVADYQHTSSDRIYDIYDINNWRAWN